MGPLDGIRVVELGDLGELAGKLLADAGATVVRVEPPEGAASRFVGPFAGDTPGRETSLKFAYLNTNKLSFRLDFDGPDAGRIWSELVRNSDVVIDSLGPGVLDARSVGYETTASASTVWCSITPFGLTGPWRDRPFNDLVQMALGGILMMCGYDDHELPPVRPDGEHSLAMAGEYAVAGILAALWQRAELGQGQLVDVSIHEAVAGTTEGAFMNWEYVGRNPSRVTGRHAGTVERWQLQSGEGEYMVLFGGGVPRDRKSLAAMLAWMDEHDAAGDLHDPKYEAIIYTPPMQGGELRARFAEHVALFIATRPTEEVYRRGQAIGMPWAPVRRPEENLDDPHWADRGFWLEGPIAVTDKRVLYPGSPYRFTRTPLEFRSPAPRLDEPPAFSDWLGHDSPKGR